MSTAWGSGERSLRRGPTARSSSRRGSSACERAAELRDAELRERVRAIIAEVERRGRVPMTTLERELMEELQVVIAVSDAERTYAVEAAASARRFRRLFVGTIVTVVSGGALAALVLLASWRTLEYVAVAAAFLALLVPLWQWMDRVAARWDDPLVH